MIIDRGSFLDLTSQLETCSREYLALTAAFATWTEHGGAGTEKHEFLAVVNHLIGANEALGNMERLLRALFEANIAEQKQDRTQ